ncbi:MAG: MarR family winged helix-turn-helix transcriptional regulator [Streptosporangiales bacterium]
MTGRGMLVQAVRELVLAIEHYRGERGRAAGRSATELTALGCLYVDGPQTPTAIARHLAITTPSATELVDRLERTDRVRRQPHPDDRRSLLVELTDSGRAEIADAYNEFAARLDPVLADCNAAERQAVLNFLISAREAFIEHDTETVEVTPGSDSAVQGDLSVSG